MSPGRAGGQSASSSAGRLPWLILACDLCSSQLNFAGCIKAEVRSIYINRRRVPSGYFTARTKMIFRSSSAKTFVAIQVCREMYEFDEDGDRYYEKALVSCVTT